jgi:hypothetical protein
MPGLTPYSMMHTINGLSSNVAQPYRDFTQPGRV